jgi:hypothetical protein
MRVMDLFSRTTLADVRQRHGEVPRVGAVG